MKFLQRVRKVSYRNLISKFVIGTLVLSGILIAPHHADAAQVTSFSDTLTRLKASTNANHEIFFVSPTGIASTGNMTLTFTGFSNATVNAILFSDVDFATGSTAVCTSAVYTEQTLVASGATSAQWNVATASQVMTITSGGASATLTANKCVRIRIGTNATNQTTGVNQIQNNTAGTATIAVGGGFGDTGTIAIPIISNDQVTISATVDPTITFSISQTTVSFGSLSAATGRWATNAGGANASAATDPTAANTAHTLTVGTNASSGYTVTYNGALLTSGANTIAAATITGDSDGTVNSNQFALCGKGTSGSPTVASGYVCGTNSDYNFVAGTTTTLASATAPASSDVVSVAYLANIASSKPAGTYTTTLTYVATGNF